MRKKRVQTLAAALAAATVLCSGAVAQAATPGTIVTVAGTGVTGSSGDAGPATAAMLSAPYDAQPLPSGGFLVVERGADVIRRVSSTGTITTVAGQSGQSGFAGDGGLATAAKLATPSAVAVLSDTSYLIADTGNQRVRLVSSDGTISTVAGGGAMVFSEGAAATSIVLSYVRDVAALPGGGFLIAASCRVFRVDAAGKITTAAGTGTCGAGTDGGPATASKLDLAIGVAPLADGGFLISDSSNHRVRKVDAAGTITTVAGNGTSGDAGDGGPATAAELDGLRGLTELPGGGFLVADLRNNRIRRVGPDGVISTVAGKGNHTTGAADLGDGGAATAATLYSPESVAVLPDGGLLIADPSNSRVREVIGSPPANTATPVITGQALAGGTLTCSTGGWTNAPASYSYAWTRDDGTPLSAGAAYVVTAADAGHTVSCSVVATNDVAAGPRATSARVAIPVPLVPPGPGGRPAPPVAPSNRFTLGSVSVSRAGALKLALTFPAPGSVTIAAKAGKVTYAIRTLKVTRAGKLSVTVKPSTRGKTLLRSARKHHRALKVRLVETFKPTGGTARVHSSVKTVLARRASRVG